MDENTNQQAEIAEFNEEETAAFDDGWDDFESPTLEEDEPEADGEPDAQPEEPEEAEGEADEAEPESEPATSEETAEQPEEQPDEAGNQRFTLKFLGEDRDVSLDEMRELAQKGMNYDHVKEQSETLKGYETFLKELADSGDMTIEDLMATTRAKMLVQKAESEGRELSEEDALKQVRGAAQQQTAEKSETEKRQEAITRFISLYPGIDSKDIPQSVWDEAERLGDLIVPYQKYELQKLRDENAQLRQNNKNRERSTGSRRTTGATTPSDAFDEGWDS